MAAVFRRPPLAPAWLMAAGCRQSRRSTPSDAAYHPCPPSSRPSVCPCGLALKSTLAIMFTSSSTSSATSRERRQGPDRHSYTYEYYANTEIRSVVLHQRSENLVQKLIDTFGSAKPIIKLYPFVSCT